MQARTLRIATLVVPSLIAAKITLGAGTERILHAAGPALAALWVFMAGALAMRFAEARRPCRTATHRASPWDQLDVLTATGASMMWMAAAALVAARMTGWASLSVIGLLGLGSVYLAAAWTALVGGGEEPWRHATIARSVLPELATEGDPLREEIRLRGVKIPAGMRLFVTGRPTRHGAVTRYAVGSEASRADVKLESELGPAPRGDHRAPPLALWLGDVLGLTRSPIAARGEAAFMVLPRPIPVDGVRELLGDGGDDATSRPAVQFPTEGSFRIREYAAGDDTRRIHWVRSLQSNQLVVRLPDEVPPAEPAVRLILDTELAGADALCTRAPAELLDALVRVWLGIARALNEAGTRVTLVAAVARDGKLAAVERQMIARSPRESLKLGARVAWQTAIPLDAMLGKSPARQVVVSSRPRRVAPSPSIPWVVVPEVAWTSPEPRLIARAPVTLPYPSGSADNRLGRRARERRRVEMMWSDRTMFSQVMCWVDWATYEGAYVARPAQGRVKLAVVP